MNSKGFRDLFRWYGIPPSPLHSAMQEAAKQEGWTPPWEREEQTAIAGQKSGHLRAERASIRRHFVKVAFDRLKPSEKFEPFAGQSITALMRSYRALLSETGQDADMLMSAAPFKASRETLIADLKVLGIRSKRQTHRSG